MDVPSRALAFGIMGLFMILWTAWCLWSGRIPSADGAPCTRADDRFRFNAYIFGFALIASLFIGAAFVFYTYPDAGRRPALEEALED